MLYRMSIIIIFFYVNFFVKQRRKERNISVLLELLVALWYNDVNNLIRCGGFGGYDVACHGAYWCGFI